MYELILRYTPGAAATIVLSTICTQQLLPGYTLELYDLDCPLYLAFASYAIDGNTYVVLALQNDFALRLCVVRASV